MTSGLRPVLVVPFLALVLMPFLLFGFLSVRIFETRLLPEVEAQTITAAMGVQRRLNHAIATFGGLHTLRDVEPVLDSARSSASGMSFLALTGPQGEIRHLSTDDTETVDLALTQIAEPVSLTFADRLSAIWEQITGAPLLDTVTMTSRRAGDLLITSLPLGGDPLNPAGALHAGVDIGLLDALKQDIWFDTATLVLATVLVAVELLILIFAVFILRPAWMVDFLTARLAVRDLRFTVTPRRGGALQALIRKVDGVITRIGTMARSRSAQSLGLRLPEADDPPRPIRPPAVSYIRLPLFLFFLSEAVLRPILPQFLGQFAPPDSDPNFRTGLAMAGFMAASLVTVLVGSILAEQNSPRRVFLWGALFSCAGMAGHLMAEDFTMILLMRALTGCGYGLVYAAGQVYIAQHARPSRRSSGFSLFLAAIVAAEITGPALGGILADRLGQQPVLVAAALAAGISALACLLLISGRPPDLTDSATEPAPPSSSGAIGHPAGLSGQWDILREILKNPRFLVVIVCFAIPAKALLTGGVFLLVPLAVVAVGGNAADSARVLMGYGVAILLLAPLLAPLADRWRGFSVSVATGSVIAGVGFILPHAWGVLNGGGLSVLLAATLLFGVGQTLSIPTQVSLLMQVADRQMARTGPGPVLGVFRFLERLGSLAGPLIAGGLLLAFPPDMALMWMGLGAALLAACGMSWLLAVGQQNEEETIRALLIET